VLLAADIHLVGKEIIRFHAVYWRRSHGCGLPPKQVWAHGWLLMDAPDEQALGNVVGRARS